jgi:hypothetical protein
MKKTLLALFTFTLSGCLNNPQSTDYVGANNKIRVDFLFEKDGVRVYRFNDDGYYHYFTTNGETISRVSKYREENIKPQPPTR